MSENKTPSIFDSKLFQQHLIDHIRTNGGTSKIGGQDFLQSIVKDVMQALLQVEMDEHLGYPKYAPEGKNSGNSRNGAISKSVRGDFGEITIDTPRDRNGEFEPQIIKKRETTLPDFSEKIISLYARGMTTREIEDHLREMYGIDIAPSFISKATECVNEQVIEWQHRPLETVYPIVYVDGMRISVRGSGEKNSGPVLKKVVYTVLGISTEGVQSVLGLWIAETEGAHFWLKVCNDLKARGVKDIIIACVDGLPGLPEAISAVFPDVDVQLCVVHQVRNATKFVAWKDRKKFCADMRNIYTAPTIEAVEYQVEQLAQIWEKQYPASVESWRRNWDALTTFFKYPVELRKVIYTTNAIESLHSRMRKNTSNRKVFPTDESVLKLLFLNVRNFSCKWTRRQNWDIVMNQLSIMYRDRINYNSMEAM